MTQSVMNLRAIVSSQSASRGVSGACPSPLSSVIVTSALGDWGRYQWHHRDRDSAHGYPSTNPLSPSWGLGRGDDFEYECAMPHMVEVSHQQIITLSGPAPVFAWLYWAHPHGLGNVSAVVRMANNLLPYEVKKHNAEQWLAAVAGSVLGVLGGGSEFADNEHFFSE